MPSTSNPLNFKEIWSVDFEYKPGPNRTVIPVCVVAKELHSQKIVQRWLYQQPPIPMPYSTGKESLYLAFTSHEAELNCHAALNWPMPHNLLDLSTESKILFNGHSIMTTQPPWRLLFVAKVLNIETPSDAYKKEMRDLIINKPTFTKEEQTEILQYCLSDVLLSEEIYNKLRSHINHGQAIYRGKYLMAVLAMTLNGIPIDLEVYHRLNIHFPNIKDFLVKRINKTYNVFDGLVFKDQKFEKYLIEHNIAWPRTPTGRLATDKDTFKTYCKSYPELEPLRQVKNLLNKIKLHDLEIGEDGRNRASLWPYGTKTGRNRPSSKSFIFGNDSWMRGLIKPGPGVSIAYLDYAQQEIGIGAKLSGDSVLTRVYNTEDPYIAFAKLAGAVPANATKASHPNERSRYKACLLGVNYGLSVYGLANQAGISLREAKKLLDTHKKLFSRFWEWLDNTVDAGRLNGSLSTCFGFRLLSKHQETLTLRNFMLQAHGAEILRLACIGLLDAGIKVCAPVHDAVLIESKSDRIYEEIEKSQLIMINASKIVLDGFALRTEATVFNYPNRFMDKRGIELWNYIMSILNELDPEHRDFSYNESIMV